MAARHADASTVAMLRALDELREIAAGVGLPRFSEAEIHALFDDED